MNYRWPRRERVISPRERQVIALVAECKCDKEIAASLNISVPTAKFHVRNLLRHFRVNKRSELIVIYLTGDFLKPMKGDL